MTDNSANTDSKATVTDSVPAQSESNPNDPSDNNRPVTPKPGPNTVDPNTFNTPTRVLGTLDPETLQTGLDRARDSVMADLGPIPILPYEDFVRDAMPRDIPEVSETTVEEIKKILRKEEVIISVDIVDEKGNVLETVDAWADFPTPPSEFNGDESAAFQNLKPLYKAISKAARAVCTNRDAASGEPAIARLDNTSNFNLLSEANNSSRCDAALVIDDEIPKLSDLDQTLESATQTLKDLKLEEEKKPAPTRAILRRKVKEGVKYDSSESNLTRRDISKRSRSKERRNSNNSDSVEKEAKWRQSWHRIAVHFEYKKKKTDPDCFDNKKKCLWGGNHTLRNDPCRRFTFGITMEDIIMRVWKFTRAGVAVSEAINWFEDLSKVIAIFAFFATASKTELGWDPTVERVMVDKTIQYMYTVKGKQYITSGKPLSDFRADVLLGRGTRVYDVYERGTDPSVESNHFAMKDLWVKENSQLEGEFLDDLRKKMEPGKEDKYFLTPLAYEWLEVYSPRSRALTKDSTRLALTIAPASPDYYMLDYEGPKSDIKPAAESMHPFSTGTVPTLDTAKMKVIEVVSSDQYRMSHREHSRTIFKEVCIPLHEVGDLQVFFQGILDATCALRTLHHLGYVHRDISTGNILYYPLEGRQVAILTDLEYHKGLSDTFTHDDYRTGTYQFMPIDVHGRDNFTDPSRITESTAKLSNKTREAKPDGYDSEKEDFLFRFKSKTEEPMPTEHLDPEDIESLMSDSDFDLVLPTVTNPVKFRYTIIHDFESLLWMALWGLSHFYPEKSGVSRQNPKLLKHVKIATSLFPKAGASLPINRFSVIMLPGILEKCLSGLDSMFKFTVIPVSEMKTTLLKAYNFYYEKVQENSRDNSGAEDFILKPGMEEVQTFYEDFRKCLRSVVQNTKVWSVIKKTVYLPSVIGSLYGQATDKSQNNNETNDAGNQPSVTVDTSTNKPGPSVGGKIQQSTRAAPRQTGPLSMTGQNTQVNLNQNQGSPVLGTPGSSANTAGRGSGIRGGAPAPGSSNSNKRGKKKKGRGSN